MNLQPIQNRIFSIRGIKVMIDFHLAELYNVETKAINQAVKRNLRRFPEDFMFQLNSEEWDALKNEMSDFKQESNVLRSQIVTANSPEITRRRYTPYVFTEQGVAMLSSVLRSDHAIDVNITIMRTFVILRQNISNYADLSARIHDVEKQMNRKFKDVYEALDYLTSRNPVAPIGFKQSLKKP
jgi:hypothetical protein